MHAQTINDWLADAEQEIGANSEYLTEPDAAIGDGDHGINHVFPGARLAVIR